MNFQNSNHAGVRRYMWRCDASHICSSSPQLSSAQTQEPFFQHVTPLPFPGFTPAILAVARWGPDIHFRQRVLTALTSASHNRSPPLPLFSPRSSARLKRHSVSELSQVVKGNGGDRRHARLQGPCVPGPDKSA